VPDRIQVVSTLAILGIALIIGYAGGTVGSGDAARGSEPWTSYEDAGHGLAAEFPSSWQRAAFPMFTRIVNPRSILALSTFAIPRGAGRGECGYVPSQVQEGVGRAGAAVLISELYREPGGIGPKVARRTPERPTRFQLDAEIELRTAGTPSHEWLFNFKDGGRLLTAAVVLGPDVSAGLRANVIRVLDGLRFNPPPPGRKV
jgi:hypothetical protein